MIFKFNNISLSVALTVLSMVQSVAMAEDITINTSVRQAKFALTGGSFTITKNGLINISNTASYYNALTISSATDIINNGSITAKNGAIMSIGGDGSISGSIINNGTITSGVNKGTTPEAIPPVGIINYHSSIAGDIINTGIITGETSGIRNDEGTVSNIINSGSITNSGTATRYNNVGIANVNNGVITGSIINSGIISNTYAIYNTGTISGGVFNSGVLDGIVYLNAAALTIIGDNARITRELTSTAPVNIEGNFTAEANADISLLSVSNDATFLIAPGLTWTATGTEVNSGTLSVDGTLISSVLVNSGATLTGNGTVGSTTVSDGGTISPNGNDSYGTLTIDGDLVLASGSNYNVNVDANGGSDHIYATGRAALDGTNLLSIAANGNWDVSSTYTILTADHGVNGKFGSVSSNFAFLNPILSYDANDVYLSLGRNDVDFAAISDSINQHNTAEAIENLNTTALYNSVVQLDSASARNAFDQLSGEAHASTRGALLNDSSFLRDGILRHDNDGQPYSLWVDGHTGSNSIDSNGNAGRASGSSHGVMLGGDLAIGAGLYAGAVIGSDRVTQQIDKVASNTRADGTHYGLYLQGGWNSLLLRTGISRSNYDVGNTRSIAFTGYSNSLNSQHDASADSAFIEASYDWTFGISTLQPYVGIAHTRLSSDGFSERGGDAALSVAEQNDNVTTGSMGLKTRWDISGGRREHASLMTKIGWEHNSGDIDTSSKQALNGQNFTVYGLPLERDAAVVELAFGMNVTPSSRIQLGYQGRYSSAVRENGANLQWSLSF